MAKLDICVEDGTLRLALDDIDITEKCEIVSWTLHQSVETLRPRMLIEMWAPQRLAAYVEDVEVVASTTRADEPWVCASCGIGNDPSNERLWSEDGACWRCGEVNDG